MNKHQWSQILLQNSFTDIDCMHVILLFIFILKITDIWTVVCVNIYMAVLQKKKKKNSNK